MVARGRALAGGGGPEGERAGDAGLEVAEDHEACEVDVSLDDRAGDRRPDPGEHAGRPEQRHAAGAADQPGERRRLVALDAGDVDDHDLRLVPHHPGEQRPTHLLDAHRIEYADQRQDDHAVGDREQGRRQGLQQRTAGLLGRARGLLLLGDVAEPADDAEELPVAATQRPLVGLQPALAAVGLTLRLDAEADDPTLSLRMASASSPELFSPPVFAALCSSNLRAAVTRLATHKRLMAPMSIVWTERRQGLEVSWRWDDPALRPPRLLTEFELVFLVQLARIGTRGPIVPLRVACPHAMKSSPAFAAYFGVEPVVDVGPKLVFSAADGGRPFVTASESLWRSFQPELARLREDAEAGGSTLDRVRAAIRECLPSGEISIDAAAERLRVGRRTLQRRLSEDGVTFRHLVREVREVLADHYLRTTTLPYAEVSFLLGFDEPSSFFRAFREWTGATPQAVRARAARRGDAGASR